MAVALMHRVAARHGLPPIGRDDDFAQMAPLPVPHQDAAALRERLFEQRRIEVPVTQHGGHTIVRVPVQGYNDEADLRALEDALAPLQAQTGPQTVCLRARPHVRWPAQLRPAQLW
jgi:isopenicillin-N epimerase